MVINNNHTLEIECTIDCASCSLESTSHVGSYSLPHSHDWEGRGGEVGIPVFSPKEKCSIEAEIQKS